MRNFDVMLPEFKDIIYNILEFGAQEGGLVNCKEAIQKAIDTATSNGGGKVIIPKGMFLTGPIEIKSNVNLHLENSAFLVFSKNKEEYPLIVTDWEGTSRIRTISPIMAKDATNIAITGTGIIDGSGHLWRPVKKWKLTDLQWEKNLLVTPYTAKIQETEIWFPSKTAMEGALVDELEPLEKNLEAALEYWDYYRPVLVNFVNCDKVLIDGVTLQNSPAWNLHPIFCKNFTLKNAHIKNPLWAQNGDGLDLESCENCEIANTVFSVGDDGICVKSGKGAKARETKIPTKNVHIHDCTVYEGHGGFVVGSETSRGMSNIIVEDCTFIGTNVGVRFKSALGRGGIIEDIQIRNIRMQDMKNEAIIFTKGYQLTTIGQVEADLCESIDPEDIPIMKNILIENIVCNGADKAIKISGLKDKTIYDITFKDTYIKARNLLDLENCKDIKFINTKLESDNEKVFFENKVISA